MLHSEVKDAPMLLLCVLSDGCSFLHLSGPTSSLRLKHEHSIPSSLEALLHSYHSLTEGF